MNNFSQNEQDHDSVLSENKRNENRTEAIPSSVFVYYPLNNILLLAVTVLSVLYLSFLTILYF